ncbi:MAG TPA: sigma-54 dependent transcriptional regulator, partial [Candidatus Udaeobacter sp.]|nr:sigma-54 dependent transcriptional regulator [Candidatus Udaeobacter sp.]
VSPTEATVLITGETGTGKDVTAGTVHQLSRRRRGPFLALNCGAVSPNLIESELFGHERGSFTGADRAHRGYFERASQGTLFLDEIAEMPIELQVKLLRVLETGHVTRIGGERTIPVDVRVIAATNRRLEQAVSEGKLREDLLYRLKVFSIHLPPLRDRTDDIELLVEHFLEQLNTTEGTAKLFSPEAVERLRAHAWPGNVRELRNVVHGAFILAEDTIGIECLPEEVATATPASADEEAAIGPVMYLKVGISIAEAERRLILATLQEMNGDKRQAAATLGMSLKTLYNRLNAYDSGRTASESDDLDEATDVATP